MELTFLAAQSLIVDDFHSPADRRYAQIGSAGTILPGGRILQPFGTQIETGPGAFGIVVSLKGVGATSDIGPERNGVTLLEQVKGAWSIRHLWARTPNSRFAEAADPNWKSVSTGIAFDTDRAVWVSEGASGKLRLLDLKTGNHEKIVTLNQGEWKNSFSGALAVDANRRLLYVIDQANRRVVIVDSKKSQIVGSVPAGRFISDIGLSPDGKSVYLTGTGGTGTFNVNLSGPPPAVRWIADQGGHESEDGVGVLPLTDRVYISHGAADSISVISATDRKTTAEISLRIPAFEILRGIRPAGMAFDPLTKWLLVAEAGLNAVAVIDTEKNELLGHIPVGWEPRRVAIAGDRVYVTNSQGRGTGPNLRRPMLELGETPSLHHGSVSTFVMPAIGDLAKLTKTVYSANGMLRDPSGAGNPPTSAGIRHVVLIVKGALSFDELMGDVREANNPLNRRVQGAPQLARFGMHGLADGRRTHLSVKDVAITPNQHAVAQRWAFGDNFYAGADVLADERFWHHLERHGVPYQRFEEKAVSMSEQARADRFIIALENTVVPPAFLLLRLPGDRRSLDDETYPYQASYSADNDLAVGRVLEYLSHTKWWSETVVFVTESASEEGLDHIDSHRTPFFAAGPQIRRNYVTHANSDFPGLLKTIFGILHLPPFDLRDATARGLYDIFTSEPDVSPFVALPPDTRIFDPGSSKN